MPSLHGYHGGYLRIDVSNGRVEFVQLSAAVLRRYLGGVGLGVHLMLRERAAECEALSAAAPLAFVFSPLVGGPLTTSAKFAVVHKSPLTNRLNDSLASSGFAISGKKTGADALVLRGAAAALSVLVLDGRQAVLEPATELAGASAREAEAALLKKYGPDFSAAVIGPAGERGVRYATISHSGRHAGRGGAGAVLGAKNIKAVLVRGEQRCTWSDPSGLTALAKELAMKSWGPATAKYRELGTASNLLAFNRLGALPTRNFQAGSFAGAVDLSPEALETDRKKTRQSCAACTIGCEHIYPVKAQKNDDESNNTVRLEYENLFALGPLCGVRDADSVLAASRLCDDLGIDTVSAGGTIAFAMECVERQLLDAPWLRFGDGSAVLKALELIGRREGLGGLLALGSRRLAERIGQDALAFAPQVKGLEIPGYEPRALQTMALGFAVGSRGADHNRSGAYEADFSEQADRRALSPKSAPLAVESEDRAALIDSLILCKFLRGVFTDFHGEIGHILQNTTGWEISPDELRETARRIVSAKKLFNQQAGWSPSEDTLPQRFLQTPLSDDPRASLSAESLQAAIVAYNQTRGWSPEGWLPRRIADEIMADADLQD